MAKVKKKPGHRRGAVDMGKRLLCGVLSMAMITQTGAEWAVAQVSEEPPI